MNELAVVLSDPPGDEESLGQIGNAISRVAGSFAFSHGEERSPDVNEYLWFGSRTGDEISVLDDFALNVRYFAIRSSRSERARALRDVLVSELKTRSKNELLASARGSDPVSIVHLVLGTDELDEESASLIADRLASDDPSMRFHASMAASMSGSPLLCAPLQRARQSTTDAREQRLLDAAIGSCCK